MNHSFDIEVAKKYGIEEAILLNYIYFWVEKNRANNQHFYDGNYWTYNSKKAFADLFPYMTPRKIDYALNNLIEKGLIITGYYNEKPTDRTLWYALTKMGYCILQNCEMENTKMENVNNINNNTNTFIENTFINKENIKENEPSIVGEIAIPDKLVKDFTEKAQINKIFKFWNELGIIKHTKLNEARIKAIKKRLEDYSYDEIISAMNHYVIILHDENYYWNYTWSLEDFLNRKNGFTTFLDDGSNWVSYTNRNKNINNNNPYSRQKEISKETAYPNQKNKGYI